MMKQHGKILFALAALALFSACETTDPDDPNGNSKDKTDIYLLDNQQSYALAATKDTVVVRLTVTLNEKDTDWSVSTSKDWCKVEPASGTGYGEISIIVTDNEKASERNADVVISSGGATKTIKINQGLYAGALPAESWFSKPYVDRTDREKAGLRGPVKSWYESTYASYDKYTYDEAGHLVKEEWFNTDNNTVEVRWVHSYDARGRRVKSEYKYGSDSDGSRVFTFEYDNPGKLVATDAYNWIEYKDGWVSGKDFPMSTWKDLSAIRYVDDSPAYYERYDLVYAFQPDGSLVLTETYNRERDGSNPDVSVYHLAYENGRPVSCTESGVSVTYDADGNPASLRIEGGAKSWTFLAHPRVLLAATMDEPKAQGMVAEFWARYSYNGNGDETRREHAYFSADQVYNDFYGKYFYDSHGNWTQRTEYKEPAFQHGEHFKTTATRVIEYY